MSVTFIITGNNTEIPPHIAASIKSIAASGGAGIFSDVRVNGITFRKALQFRHSAALIPGRGILVDGKMVKKLKEGDEWFVGSVEAVQTVYTYNFEEARGIWLDTHRVEEAMELY